MADSKMTALTENTTPALTDIMLITDDPGGTPASQKITLTNLQKGINPMTTAGDIILGGASGVPGRLAIGANTYVLTSNGTTAAWAAAAAASTRTLEFSDPCTDTTLITTDAGTITYDATEGGLSVPNGARLYYAQTAANISNLGDWYDVEFDIKPSGSVLGEAIGAFSATGWRGYMARVEFRGGNNCMILEVAGGSASDINGPRLGPLAGVVAWVPVVFMRRGSLWAIGHRMGPAQGAMLLASQIDTTYTDGVGFGYQSEVGATYIRNVKIYKYSALP